MSGAGHVAGDGIERLDLAGEALGAAHVDERLAAPERGDDVRGVDDHAGPRPRDEGRGLARRRLVRRHRPVLGDPGRKAAVEDGHRVVSQPSQHPPEPRRVGAGTRVVADDAGVVADAEAQASTRTRRARAADAGRSRP